MQAGLDGADRPAEPYGHRLEGQVRPLVEDHDNPFVGAQGGHRPAGLVAVEDRLEGIGLVGRARMAAIIGLGLDRNERDPGPAAQAIAADVDQDPVEPGLEAGGVA
jgi:hypothetical protein